MIKLFCHLSILVQLAGIPVPTVVATYDESSDGAESGDALAGTVVQLNLDEVLLGLLRS
jgi:hypothetical protein